MAAADSGTNHRNNRVGGFAEDELQANGQRNEGMLLRTAEEWEVVMQASEDRRKKDERRLTGRNRYA
jgi:hypothetical protein